MLDTILQAYDWYNHPEDHKFVQVHRDAYRTCGHGLYQPGEISAFHRALNNDELWLIHLGRIEVHVLSPGGVHTAHQLGTDLSAGDRPMVVIPRGHWQGAEVLPGVPLAMVSTVCAPGFSWDAFELAEQADLVRDYPEHAELIVRLTWQGDPPKREAYEQNL